MKKLTLVIGLLMWMGSTGIYVMLAAWVGQDSFSEPLPRFLAAAGYLLWAIPTGLLVHCSDLPKLIAEALVEDETQ